MKQSASKPAEPPPASFDSLGLSEVMMEALESAGYEYPTPIQAGLIPRALAGVDVMGQARTGTGKTASFAIPILERLQLKHDIHHPQALVLVPTRELAVQVRDEVDQARRTGRRVHCVAVYGGKPIREQIEKLRKRGAQSSSARPAACSTTWPAARSISRKLKFVVLDEADRMLDIGFRPDIERILQRCPDDAADAAASAPRCRRRSPSWPSAYMRDPETLNFSPKDIVGRDDRAVLLHGRSGAEVRPACCGCSSARSRSRRSSSAAPSAAPRRSFSGCSKEVQGSRSWPASTATCTRAARDRVMAAFRAGKIRFLVATDVVGRGIDVTSISHIINYDIPAFCDDYVHRVGRTGRMGREGVAYTFVTPDEGNELTRIEMRINRLLKRDEIKDFDPHARERSGLPIGDRPVNLGPKGSDGAAGSGDPAATPPPPPTSLQRRPPKRYRKAL